MLFRGGLTSVDVEGLISDQEAMTVYAYFGRAIYVSNILEHSVVNAIFVLKLLPKIRDFGSIDAWGDAVDDFFKLKFEKTFGNLLRELESCNRVTPATMMLLWDAKKVRDFLAHHFNREKSDLFFSQSGRHELIKECENAVRLLDAVDGDLEKEIAPIREALGVDDQWLEDRYREGIERLLKETEK